MSYHKFLWFWHQHKALHLSFPAVWSTLCCTDVMDPCQRSLVDMSRISWVFRKKWGIIRVTPHFLKGTPFSRSATAPIRCSYRHDALHICAIDTLILPCFLWWATPSSSSLRSSLYPPYYVSMLSSFLRRLSGSSKSNHNNSHCIPDCSFYGWNNA